MLCGSFNSTRSFIAAGIHCGDFRAISSRRFKLRSPVKEVILGRESVGTCGIEVLQCGAVLGHVHEKFCIDTEPGLHLRIDITVVLPGY